MDDYHLIFKFLEVFILLMLSGMFSGSENAFYSLDKKKVKEIKRKTDWVDKYITELVESPQRLILTILAGNTIVNITVSILGVVISRDLAVVFNINQQLSLTVVFLFILSCVLVFGEILPKSIAYKNPYQFIRIIIFPLYWINVLFYPVTRLLSELFKSFSSSNSFYKHFHALNSNELPELTELGVDTNSIDEDEKEMIQDVVSFQTVTAREVMTPRVDMIAVPVTASFEELVKIINETGHSRIPVYKQDMDEITGIINAKDLFQFLADENKKENISLESISRETIFVPESKLISDLLQEFQAKKIHLGIVVDEYGGTAGLISMEDILEEIVGEIRDEYDEEETEISDLGDGRYEVLGKASIDSLSEYFEFDFSAENNDYETVGGFIFNHAGSIPVKGFSFDYFDYRFEVMEIENKRVNKVFVQKIEKNTEEE